MYVCTCVRVYVSTCACVRVRVRVHVYVYVCVRVCMYVRVRVHPCIYLCMYQLTFFNLEPKVTFIALSSYLTILLQRIWAKQEIFKEDNKGKKMVDQWLEGRLQREADRWRQGRFRWELTEQWLSDLKDDLDESDQWLKERFGRK